MDMQAKCSDRIGVHLESRFADLKALYRTRDCDNAELLSFAQGFGIDVLNEDGEPFQEREDGEYEPGQDIDRDALENEISEHRNEYGLSFDYVAPHTFKGQAEGYWCFLLSWGGPADEIRMFGDHEAGDRGMYRAEYWFLDWFDGACRTLSGDEWETAEAIWSDFDDMGMLRSTYEKAMEDYEPGDEDADEEEEDPEDVNA